MLSVTATPKLRPYVGQSVGQIAKEEGKHPADAMLDIVVAGKLKVMFLRPATSGDAEMSGR